MGMFSFITKPIDKAKEEFQHVAEKTGFNVTNPLKDPLKAAFQIGGIMSGVTAVRRGIEISKDPAMESLGLESGRQKEKKAAEKAAQTEKTNRLNLFNQSVANNGIDEITKREIAALYYGGVDSATISSMLNSATAGEGVYGKRQVSMGIQQYLTNSPGRRQLMASSGYGSVL